MEPEDKLPAEGPALVICDVDGVILRGYFLLALARRKGLWAGLASALDCLLYEARILAIKTQLRRVYARTAGLEAEEMRHAYDSLRIVPGAEEAIAAMREAGQEVWLVSSGVPQEVVADLVERLGANGGEGIEVETRNGLLTGRVGGALTTSAGKLGFVEALQAERGIGWSDTAVVADDRGNLDIVKRARVGVGFRSTYTIRRHANHLVDDPDFAQVAHIVTAPHAAMRDERREVASPLREVQRKLIHMLAALTVIVHPVFPNAIHPVLILAAMAYATEEVLRLNGASLPLLSPVARRVMRCGEARRMAVAPLTLAAGVLLSLALFPSQVAYAAILIVAVADSAASLVGINLGTTRLPYNRRKTVEGTLASLGAGVACALLYLPLWPALAAAAFGALIESLDFGAWDNLLLPIVAGTAGTAALAIVQLA